MEIDRYNFLLARDGKEAALRFMEGVVKTYRQYLLHSKKNRLAVMKRRKLIQSYLEAKQILSEVPRGLE